MGILSGFFSEDLAIDLGTVNTIVYAPTQGVVLNEPSVVALHKYSGEVISVGSQALKLLGREPNDTEVHRPIRRGAIDNFEISQKFLRALISRVQRNDHPRRSHLVIGVPGSSTPLERRSLKDAARDASQTQMGMYGGPDSNHAVIPITTFRAQFGRERLNNLVIETQRP